MKKTYKNYLQSQQKIKNAVIELLTERNDISEITVSDTVKRAGVYRGTFYNHYSNVFEVVEDVENDLIQTFTKELKKDYFASDVNAFFTELTKYFKENEKIYKKLLSSVSQNILNGFKEKFIKVLQELVEDTDEVPLRFIVSGFTGLYVDYFRGKINKNLDQIGYISASLVKELTSAIDKNKR